MCGQMNEWKSALREQGHELILCDAFWQVLQEENFVGRQVFVWHLHVGPLCGGCCCGAVHWREDDQIQETGRILETNSPQPSSSLETSVLVDLNTELSLQK
jgi:hypothetical protein